MEGSGTLYYFNYHTVSPVAEKNGCQKREYIEDIGKQKRSCLLLFVIAIAGLQQQRN